MKKEQCVSDLKSNYAHFISFGLLYSESTVFLNLKPYQLNTSSQK